MRTNIQMVVKKKPKTFKQLWAKSSKVHRFFLAKGLVLGLGIIVGVVLTILKFVFNTFLLDVTPLVLTMILVSISFIVLNLALVHIVENINGISSVLLIELVLSFLSVMIAVMLFSLGMALIGLELPCEGTIRVCLAAME